MKFSVSISGLIRGVGHRFTGGNGTAEVYETDDPDEIDSLLHTAKGIVVPLDYTPPAETEPLRVKQQRAHTHLMGLEWNALRALAKKRGVLGKRKQELLDGLMRQVR